MDGRIREITESMAEVADDAKETFGMLTGEQLNWKPAEGSWSIAQCLEHLIKTDAEFDAEFEKLIAGGRKNTFWQQWSPFTGMGGRFLVNAVKNDSKKVKAPSKAIVPPSEVDADIVSRFAEHISDVNRRIEAIAGIDLQKTVVTSPFLAVFTYTLDDALSVLVEHSRRHMRQAKRVIETPGFPG